MPKQTDTSIDTSGRQRSSVSEIVLLAIGAAANLAGLLLAAASNNWLLAAVFAVSLAVVVVLGAKGVLLRRIAAAVDGGRIAWKTAMPEIQRQNLNIEVSELSKLLDVGPDQLGDLQSAYIVAEDLALRQIQQDEDAMLMRHVIVGESHFDAVMVKNEVVNCIEVVFLVTPDLRQEKVDAMMKKIAAVKRTFSETRAWMKVRLMMVLVTQLTAEDTGKLRSVLGSKRFAETPVDIDIRLLDFESLQAIYVTD